MSRLTRDETTDPLSRDQILRRERGQGNIIFPSSANHEQDWQPYPVDPNSFVSGDYTYTYQVCTWHGTSVGGSTQKFDLIHDRSCNWIELDGSGNLS